MRDGSCFPQRTVDCHCIRWLVHFQSLTRPSCSEMPGISAFSFFLPRFGSIRAVYSICCSVAAYYGAFTSYYWMNTKLQSCMFLEPECAVWVYSLAKTLRLFDLRHYRASSFGEDIRNNLRNIAVPVTGLPMHLFFWTSTTAWLFFVLVYPMIAFAAAIYMYLVTRQDFAAIFREQLLNPKHWFASWRLNSFLVAWHAMVTQQTPVSQQYALEEKGAFLLAAEAKGIPFSPFLRSIGTLYAKHINIEGGMGIHVLRNFTDGGEWILQEALSNSTDLSRLLPPGTPLSTIRVITASRHWLRTQSNSIQMQQLGRGQANGGLNSNGHTTSEDGASSNTAAEDFSVLTAVLRAGRVGAATDHNSICFPVDRRTGLLSPGRSNQHWYKLGLRHLFRTGDTFGKVWTQHPDAPGYTVSGRRLPGMPAICELCTSAHRRLLPDVPLIGWDVALTAEHGPVLLELNISCNFFLGMVDQGEYLALMRAYIMALQAYDIKN